MPYFIMDNPPLRALAQTLPSAMLRRGGVISLMRVFEQNGRSKPLASAEKIACKQPGLRRPAPPPKGVLAPVACLGRVRPEPPHTRLSVAVKMPDMVKEVTREVKEITTITRMQPVLLKPGVNRAVTVSAPVRVMVMLPRTAERNPLEIKRERMLLDTHIREMILRAQEEDRQFYKSRPGAAAAMLHRLAPALPAVMPVLLSHKAPLPPGPPNSGAAPGVRAGQQAAALLPEAIPPEPAPVLFGLSQEDFARITGEVFRMVERKLERARLRAGRTL